MSTEFAALFDSSKARDLKNDKDEHPFTYCMDVIVPAMEREGKAPGDPKAFCGWWKSEHAESKREANRHLLVVGATSKARTIQWDGREHLVVPVVALVEGVVHAVNADSPELVRAEVLQAAAESWNGRPVMLAHPATDDGEMVPANDPKVMAKQGFGIIRSAKVSGTRLHMEVLVDVAKLKKLDPDLLKALQAGKPVEVSIGAHVRVKREAGEFGGKKYKAVWAEVYGDHIAFLPDDVGACSIDMGCGANRAAMQHVLTESGYETRSLSEHVSAAGIFVVLAKKDDCSLEDRIRMVSQAVRDRYNPVDKLALVAESRIAAYPERIYDDYVIVRKGEELIRIAYTIDGSTAKLGESQPVKVSYVAAAGARHSSSDRRMIQEVHDHSVALGAACSRDNYKLSAPKPTVRHEGGKWVLYSSDGSRKLGSHNTENEAVTQQKAVIEFLQRRNGSGSNAVSQGHCTCGGHTQ